MAIIYTLVLVSISFFGINAGRVIFTLFALKLGASDAVIGFLGGMFYIFPLLLSMPLGLFADRRGPRPLLFAGSACATCGLSIPFFIPQIAALFVAAGLCGLSLAFYHVTLQNQIGLLSRPEDRPRNFSNFSLAGAMANLAGPTVAGFSIDHLGHGGASLVIASFAFFALWLLLFWNRVVPPREPMVIDNNPEAADDGGAIGTSSLWGMLAASALVQIGTDLFQFYIPVYGYSIHLSATAIGIAVSCFALASFVVRLFLARMVARFPAERLLAGAFFMGALGYAMVPFTGNAWMVSGAAFIFGLGMGIGTPLTVMMMFSRSTKGRSGRDLGLRLTSNNLVRVSGPVVFGAIVGALGLLSVFWINAALLFSGAVIAQRSIQPRKSSTHL